MNKYIYMYVSIKFSFCKKRDLIFEPAIAGIITNLEMEPKSNFRGIPALSFFPFSFVVALRNVPNLQQ